MGSNKHGHRNSAAVAGSTQATPPHVLVFPFPLQGHVSPMLKLAELLALIGIPRVTFFITNHNVRRLLESVGVRDRLARRPNLHLRSFPDGLSEDNPRDGSRLLEVFEALDVNGPPHLRKLLAPTVGVGTSDEPPPVTCLVADGNIRFTVDVAEELGVPVIAFRTSSACSVRAYQSIPELCERGIIPFKDRCDLDELVACVPGMESFLRRRDLPSLCQTKDIDDPLLRRLKELIRNASRYRGLILNTLDFLESSTLAQLRGLGPPTYSIGPLHALLPTIERSCGAENGEGDRFSSSNSNYSASLWQEDRACVEWLDARPPASVVYVSFGSVALLSREKMLDLRQGLVNSGYHFLWVVRPGLVGNGEDVLAEVAKGTGDRGFFVRWAPQGEVLAHPAVGCFLTHSGWNSTIESMWAGVPMVCLPYFADQLINSRFVAEVWRIGVDMKDRWDKTTVERAVKEVMMTGSEVKQTVGSISLRERECVAAGGSSTMNLERLIRDIRAMSSD